MTMSFGYPGDDGLGDRLIAAVLSGEKTATSSLAIEYLSGEPLPRVGERLALTDHDGRVHGTVETTRVTIVPKHLVGDDVAHDEGEGFADAADWRAAHDRFWADVTHFVREDSGDPDWVLREAEPVVVQWFRLLEVSSTRRSQPVDGFVLAYDDVGSGDAIVLLHGWPGDRTDHRELVALLAPHTRVIAPDLRGFGESDRPLVEPAGNYDAAAQARSVAGLIEELGVGPVVLGGYDVGSRVAQALARDRPDLVRAMVLAPPMPGAGERVLTPESQAQFWYQALHRLALAEQLVDGRPDAVRAYLRHFWTHWSGPSYDLDEAAFEALAARYSAPGAFTASINWYRAGAGTVAKAVGEQVPADRIAAPTTVLWPEHDPLFPRAWSDRLQEFFADVTLRFVDRVGHFAPLEYPDMFAAALLATLR